MINVRPRHGKYVQLPHEMYNVGELARMLPLYFRFSGNALVLEDGVVLKPDTPVKEGGEYTFLRCWPERITRRLELNENKKDEKPEFQFKAGIGLPYQNQVREHALRTAAWEMRQTKFLKPVAFWDCGVPGLAETEQAFLPPEQEGLTIHVY